MKKIAALLLIMILPAAMPVTAFAHGHGTKTAGAAYALCSVENCNTVGYHTHGTATYAGHYMGDGHDYHQLCDVRGCTETGSHDHDGTICLPHGSGDGHTYHRTNRQGGHC